MIFVERSCDAITGVDGQPDLPGNRRTRAPLANDGMPTMKPYVYAGYGMQNPAARWPSSSPRPCSSKTVTLKPGSPVSVDDEHATNFIGGLLR